MAKLMATGCMDPRAGVTGSLRLEFAAAPDGPTELVAKSERPPLRVVRAFPGADREALIHLHNVSGGVLGGDLLELEVRVRPGARAQLTTTGATRVYRRGPHAGEAIQCNRLRVEENALLEYLPDPLIPYRGARYRQSTEIELASGAGLFWWETLTPGREAYGERFQFERVMLETEIRTGEDQVPVARERALLEPARHPLDSPFRMGPYGYLTTFYICRAGVPASAWRSLETELSEPCREWSRPGETIWGASSLARDGVVVRALSVSGRELPARLFELWRIARRRLYGLEAVLPRKVP